jgi:O-antigen/teichoic acid export membrane protein
VLAPDSYGGVAELFPIFALAMLISGFANSLQLGHQIAKRTAWISASAFIAFAVNLGVMTWLTPIFGLAAAGWAMLACFVVKAMVVYWTAQSRHFIPYDPQAFALFGVGAAALIGASALSSAGVLMPGPVTAIATLIVGAALAMAIVGRAELRALRGLLASRLGGWGS